MQYGVKLSCVASKIYTQNCDSNHAKGVMVHCFKENGHKEKDGTSHEGQIFIDGDYLGTMTW